MNNPTSKIRQYEELIHSVWVQLNRKRVISAILIAVGIVILLLTLAIILESVFWFSPLVKIGIWTFVVASGIVSGIWVLRNLTSQSFTETYMDFSRQYNQDNFRYALDLHSATDDAKYGLYADAIQQNLAQIDESKLKSEVSLFNKSHPISEYSQISNLTFGSGFVLIVLMLSFAGSAVNRLSNPLTSFERPNPFEFMVSPGNTILEQGVNLRVQSDFSGDLPSDVILLVKTSNESDFRSIRMDMTDGNQFSVVIPTVFEDLDYYIQMDGYQSNVYTVDVQLLPRFSELQVNIEPPAYTRLPNFNTVYPFRLIEAYPGSKLRIRGRVNKPIIGAELNINSSDQTQTMSQFGDLDYEFEYAIESPDSLWFGLWDSSGLRNRNTFNFNVELLEDQLPEVRFLSPSADHSLMDPVLLELIFQLSDDFGFSSVSLKYQIERSYGTSRISDGEIRLRTPSENVVMMEFDWDLSDFNLLPMDVVRYWIEVRDNDRFANFKLARSNTQILRVSSLSDFLLAQEEREMDIANKFENFQEAYEQNQRELDELRREILENRSENWEQAELAEEVKERREELSKQLDEIREQFEELSNEMQSGNEMSDETKEMYENLKQLIKEIDDPEILKALEMLQQGLENLDQNMVRDALQQIEFNEERFKERLNRTMELFKALQMNAELDRMSSLLEDLAKREETLIGDNLPETEEQLNRQEQILEDLNQVNDRMNKIEEKSPDRSKNQIEQLKESIQSQTPQVQEKLKDDIDSLQSDGENSDSSESNSEQQQRREDIKDQLQQMQKMVSESKAAMNQQSIQVNRQALLSIMQSLLQLSEAQEDIVIHSSEIIQGSAAFVDLARRQRTITRGFNQLADSLVNVSAEIPSFPNRINTRRAEISRNLDRSVELMAERDRNRATAESRVSLGGINEIASLLADLLDKLDDSGGEGSGSGGMSMEQMLEQLQNMSGDQQMLNEQIQDMINDLQGERLMQDQMERLDQMARQQNEIRRQLRDIQQRGGLNQGDQIMSELQRLSEQMEESINDLRGGYTERIMIERQQNILSRMLQAERALNEREEDEQRRGAQPEPLDRVSPAELTLEALREQIRRSLRDPDETRFTDEYQRLIQRYFELLEQTERRQIRP
jgi:DNA repair exonuclease SbcCD ATPase subunit